MASGGIVGECVVCKEWVYEDEWAVSPDGKPFAIFHKSCVRRYGKQKQRAEALERVAAASMLVLANASAREDDDTYEYVESMLMDNLREAVDRLGALQK